MAAFPDDFEESSNNDSSSPLLPREDRLWRHPSELGDSTTGYRAADQAAVRRRWLQNEPSRASAWTAGLVGALLATGIVALGVHLVEAIPSGSGSDSNVITATTLLTSSAGPRPASVGVDPVLVGAIDRVGSAVVAIEAIDDGSPAQFLGVIVSRDGVIIAPAVDLNDATSVLVTVPKSVVPDVGHLVGIDRATGLAVLKVKGYSDLPSALLGGTAFAPSSFALAITAPLGVRYALGDVQASDVGATGGGTSLVDEVSTDLQAADAPLGSPLLDANGIVSGIVVGRNGDDSLVTPSWIATPILNQLLANGSVQHGWLGINGTTKRVHGTPSGVVILSVAQSGAGAEAGLRPGDVIVSLDNEVITSMPALQGRLYILKPGARITLDVAHGAQQMTMHTALDDNS